MRPAETRGLQFLRPPGEADRPRQRRLALGTRNEGSKPELCHLHPASSRRAQTPFQTHKMQQGRSPEQVEEEKRKWVCVPRSTQLSWFRDPAGAGRTASGRQGTWRGKSGTSGFPELLRTWTQTKCPWDQGLPSRVQTTWGYVSTGSFKRINTPVINFQMDSSLKSMCWRCGSGRGASSQLALLPTSLPSPPSHTTNKTILLSPTPPWCPPWGLPTSRFQATRRSHM